MSSSTASLKDGTVIVRMVNTGVGLTVTTHSYIIPQHVNNMCRLQEKYIRKNKKCHLESTDVLNKDSIAIYQFRDGGDYLIVERIPYIVEPFHILTF